MSNRQIERGLGLARIDPGGFVGRPGAALEPQCGRYVTYAIIELSLSTVSNIDRVPGALDWIYRPETGGRV